MNNNNDNNNKNKRYDIVVENLDRCADGALSEYFYQAKQDLSIGTSGCITGAEKSRWHDRNRITAAWLPKYAVIWRFDIEELCNKSGKFSEIKISDSKRQILSENTYTSKRQ